ncbi:alpha/beta fold hydrolase [Niabella drilacis]|uniref:Pimeloyl-ACP methyl ester carboxylesterase n=1 Tax=Niabella drilacis (strain DSM 25811 / CCM 8410 / CCUG 62505 / LMG 26954 / E90) TaxID=1285928 RepID=A0A1G6T218_NIADE|nr:alpha/beta hydrolase [Niabella drilacis]SDD23041.1 Pimeloyl-ACP methyl ester carboxylesterase [Niabella drilacis]
MGTKTIHINDSIIHYTVEGIGRPVVLLHGFGEDGTVWDNQVEYLRHNYQVIVPDIPGSGQSELTDDVSMEGIADMVRQIIDAEELESVVLIGHSMGGYATLAFAERYSHLLDGFGLFHSTGAADTEEKKETRRKGIVFIEKNGADAFLKTTIPNLFSERTKNTDPDLVKNFTAALPSFSKTALKSYYEAMIARPERIDLFSKTELPVLFIIGEQDSVISFEDILKQASMPRVSCIHILHQSGHMGMLEEAGKANAAIEAFLMELKQ